MPTVDLTARLARETKPGDRDVFLFDRALPGFGLRVHRSGAKAWIVQTRIEGKSRRVVIARHGEMDLAQARRHARDILARIRAGDNPADDIRKEKTAPTVAMLADEYLRRCDPYWKPSGRKTIRIYLKARILPTFGKMPVERVGPEDVAAWFDAVSKDRPGAANRAFEILRSLMFWADEYGFRELGTNPCLGIRKNPRRDIARFLDADELARLGRALDAREDKWPEASPPSGCWHSPAAAGAKCSISDGATSGTTPSPCPTPRLDRAACRSAVPRGPSSRHCPNHAIRMPTCFRASPKPERQRRGLTPRRTPMPPPPGVDVDSMAPHSPLGLSRFPLYVLVPVAIGSDRVSFPDEPLPDILAVAGYDADRTSKFVIVLDRDVNSLAADLADQGALHTLSMSEPVAVMVLGPLIPLGRVETREPYFLPGYANPVAVGDIGFPGERARAALSAGAASLARALPEQSLENKVQPRRDDEEDDQRFHRSRYSAPFRVRRL